MTGAAAVRGRGGAPPWRRVYAALGWEDTAPARDSTYSDRLAAQARKRTPDQLIAVIAELEDDLGRFRSSIGLARDYRALDLPPRGAHALALNELWRFGTVARTLASACIDRPAHALDERTRAGALHEAASRLMRELDRSIGADLLAFLARHAGGFTEPAPGLVAARRQRRLAVAAFTLLIAALVAGVIWVLAGARG